MADRDEALADMELMDELELLASESGSDAGESISLGSRSSKDGSDSEDDGEEPQEITEEHYSALRSTVVDIVTALGGIEDSAREDGSIEAVYAIGDDCLRCLRDLRSLLHQDQDNPLRTVSRVFGEVNVVQRGLLPLLLKTADMGERGSKIALACTDILTTLTWPIDVAAEQQAIVQKDGDAAALDSLSHMQGLLVSYKFAVLTSKSQETKGTQRSILSTLTLYILLPSLSKARHERSERDIGIISMCMHLFRNLVAIKDPLATSLSSNQQIALSNLQSDLIMEMHRAHILDTIMMLASNAGSRDYEPWNIIAAECILHLFVSSNPTCLLPCALQKVRATSPQDGLTVGSQAAGNSSSSSSSLQKLLLSEAQEKRNMMLSSGASRHSRYTTSITFRSADGELRTATAQSALRKDSESLNQQWKEKTKRKIRRRRKLEEAGASLRGAPWSAEAIDVLSKWAQTFIKTAFETLVRSVVKDLRAESAKAGDLTLTRIRVMQVSTFFLRFFLLLRQASKDDDPAENSHDTGTKQGNDAYEWPFDLIGYWMEPWALKMAWMRAATAREDRAWLEFVTAVKLWTTLLQTVEAMSRSGDAKDRDSADGIQAAHFYDELALDSAKAVTKTYSSQSFRCLETIIEFSYTMPRLLEKYSKDKDNLYVKAKKQVRQTRKDGEQANDTEEQQNIRKSVEDQIKERKFEFEKFQMHISSNQLAEASLSFLQRWREVREDVEGRLSAAVHVLHRLVIKAGSCRLLYPHRHRVSLRYLQNDLSFWQFLKERAPQAHSDAGKLIKYIFQKFDRLDDSEKVLWAEGMKAPKPVKVFKMPSEIAIVPSRGREEDIRLAVGLLVEKDLLRIVSWLKTALEEAYRVRDQIVHEEIQKLGSEVDDSQWPLHIPPSALEKFSDFQLPYNESDTLREDASIRPEVKLICRLLNLESNEEDDHHWIWTIPAYQVPEHLEQTAEMLDNAIRFPPDLFGERFDSLVTRVRKAPPKRRVAVNENGEQEEVYVPRGRGSRKAQRTPTWLDDDLIEDSDEEMEAVARLMQQNQSGNGSSSQRIRSTMSRSSSDSESDRDSDDLDSDSASDAAGARNHSSPTRARESSATSSEVLRSASKNAERPQKRKRLLRRVEKPISRDTDALFLGTESDEDEGYANALPEQSVIGKEAVPAREPFADVQPPNDAAVDAEATEPIMRKRRALIIDDDDDDDE